MTIDGEIRPETKLLTDSILALVNASQDFLNQPTERNRLRVEEARENIQLALDHLIDKQLQEAITKRLEQFNLQIQKIL